MAKIMRPRARSWSYKPQKGYDDQGREFFDGTCKECGSRVSCLYQGVIWYGPEWLEEYPESVCYQCLHEMLGATEVEVL